MAASVRGLWRAAFACALLVGGVVASPPAHPAACASAALPREGFAAAVERNAPAVVQVVVLRSGRDPMEDAAAFEFFQPMQGLPLPGGESLDRTFSSGFFISPDGFLLASAHAVFDARGIWVVMADGRRLRAQVHGLDRRRDVALLKVDATGLPFVRTGPPASLCPGAWLIAMGSPFGFDRTVTAGVVSTYPRYLHGSNIPLIQSDVVTNPGSSGGPVFDAEGRLAGMSTMIFSASGLYLGMSFALPAAELLRTAEMLRRTGLPSQGDIGIGLQPLTADLARAFGLAGEAGSVAVRVDEGGAAARAGLHAGDIVLGFARGERIGHDAIESGLAAALPGESLGLEIWRERAVQSVRIEVGTARREPLPAAGEPLGGESRLGLQLAVLKARVNAPAGIYVESATGSALLAGLERGDRIVAVNAAAVANVDDFDRALEAAGNRAVIALLVGRGGTVVYVPVTRGR